MSEIGEAVKHCRGLRGWTQTELARRADLTASAVWQIEAGLRSPNTTTFIKLADALDIDMNVLAGRHADGRPVPEFVEASVLMMLYAKLPARERNAVMAVVVVLADEMPEGDNNEQG